MALTTIRLPCGGYCNGPEAQCLTRNGTPAQRIHQKCRIMVNLHHYQWREARRQAVMDAMEETSTSR